MKIFKILLANILLVFIVLFVFEFYVYKTELKAGSDYFPFLYPYYTHNLNKKWDDTYVKILKNEVKEIESGFRRTKIDESIDLNKSGILLFGCSFAYGAQLEDNETLSYYLSKYSKRPVYNRAFSGWGIQGMLYQLNLPDFIASLKYNITPDSTIEPDYNNIDYVIYVFIGDHARRQLIPCCYFDNKFLFYNQDKNKENLIRKGELSNLYWHSYILRKSYRNRISNIFYDDKSVDLFYRHLKASGDKIKELFPQAKFTVLAFDGNDFMKKVEDKLNDENISILYLSDLSDIDFYSGEYVIPDFEHPTGKSWDVISKLLIEKLNL